MINIRKLRFKYLKEELFLLLLIILHCDVANAAAFNNTPIPNSSTNKSNKNVCQTSRCIKDDTFLVNTMDQTVNPCDNFYQFACGNFKKSIQLYPNTNINAFESVGMEESKKIINKLKKKKTNDLNTFVKLKQFFKSCTKHNENEKFRTISRILNDVTGSLLLQKAQRNNSEIDWKKFVHRSVEQHIPILVPVFVYLRVNEYKNFELNVESPRYMKEEDVRFHISSWVNHLRRGLSFSPKAKEINDIIQFEKQLETEFTAYYNEINDRQIFSIKELSENVSNIPFNEIFHKLCSFENISFDEKYKVSVSNYKALLKFDEILKTVPKKLLVNFVSWRLFLYLNSFSGVNVCNNVENDCNLEDACLVVMKQLLPIALNTFYYKSNTNKNVRKDISSMVQNIKNVIKNNLENIDWLDDISRNNSLEKLASMQIELGHLDIMEDRVLDEHYKKLQIEDGKWYQNLLRVNWFNGYKYNHYLLTDELRLTNFLSSTDVNAAHKYGVNIVDIPLSILQGRFYQFDRPQYLNYGMSGTIIGHEIIHGYDTRGRFYDKKGDQNDLLTSKAHDVYTDKKNCLIKQYDNFTFEEIHKHVNGTLTINENIADNGGYKAAYHAYNEWIKMNEANEKSLPSFKTYTPRQMFWISAASAWCTKTGNEALNNFCLNDVHSPAQARIINTFSNIKEFADDWKCKPGTRMNPSEKCVLW